jgi:hypothetical protein
VARDVVLALPKRTGARYLQVDEALDAVGDDNGRLQTSG